MAVPRNRMSNARKNSKRAHHAKQLKSLTTCPKCRTPRLTHTQCQACGYYKEERVAAAKI